jgi:PleD family two-component response regulator
MRRLLFLSLLVLGAGFVRERAGRRRAERSLRERLDEANLDQVFQAFYTTKAAGMGMGLTIARAIVEAHGGRLTARNNPAIGATVAFTLPSDGDDEGPPEARVFIVDDDASVRKSLTRLLTSAGFEVEALPSVQEFLARPRYEARVACCWTCGCPV